MPGSGTNVRGRRGDQKRGVVPSSSGKFEKVASLRIVKIIPIMWSEISISKRESHHTARQVMSEETPSGCHGVYVDTDQTVQLCPRFVS